RDTSEDHTVPLDRDGLKFLVGEGKSHHRLPVRRSYRFSASAWVRPRAFKELMARRRARTCTAACFCATNTRPMRAKSPVAPHSALASSCASSPHLSNQAGSLREETLSTSSWWRRQIGSA